MTRKQSTRKKSDIGQFEIAPSDREAALLALPLKTHIDMVTLTLDNLDLKLGAMREMRDALGIEEQGSVSAKDQSTHSAKEHDASGATEFELLKRLSERLMLQKVRIEREIEQRVGRGEDETERAVRSVKNSSDNY